MNRLVAFLILLSIGCKNEYAIPVRTTDKSLLVVEGSLRVGNDSTVIMLSKTINVNEKLNFKPELKARLTVEDKNGGSFVLKENGNGVYSHLKLGLVPGNEYRLRIKTADNKEYLSEYVLAKVTPAIDSISWKKERNGDCFIYANAHDNTGNTRYYKWDYDETWEINSTYWANYYYVGGSNPIIPSPTAYHSRCWKYNKSTTINVGTTAHLSADVLSEFPLVLIESGSEKLGVRYSIMVRQESLDKKAYEYLMLMKKNTESIGSVFDPLPSDSKGNIQCVSNPGEDVVGFMTSSSLVKKRIFITKLEADWNFNLHCPQVLYVPNNADSIKKYMPDNLPIDFIVIDSNEYYTASIPVCVDCETRGGNLLMPSYW
jgi:hypothetical protein